MSDLKLPLAPLRDLLAWWRKAKTKGIIIGGLAVSLRSEARTTQDVDAVVLLDEDDWSDFLKIGTKFSFQPRYSDALAFARKHSILLVHHQLSGIDVDLSFAGTPFEREAIERATNIKLGKLSVPVATPEDLIIFKAVARRSIDIVDIEKLLDLCEGLNYEYIRRHVDHFAEILEMPEIFTILDKRLREYEKAQRRRKK